MAITNFKSKVLVAHEKSPVAPGYGATSTTSLTIGTGNKSLTTQAGTALKVGQAVRLISRADSTNYMEGPIVSYTDSAMVVSIGAVDGSGTFADWDIVPVWLPDYVATKTGTETLSNKTLSGDISFVTGTGRVGITNGSTPLSAAALLDSVYTGNGLCAIHAKTYRTGTTAIPYQNDDTSLWETFNDVQSDSQNRSWSGSFPNAYNNIPAGVYDSGTRVGVYGWAVSIARTGYVHDGSLAFQAGVHGRAGFQDVGSGASAVIENAIGVQGEVWNDSTGATIYTARAGSFETDTAVGNIQINIGVYSSALHGSTSNYSFFGAHGDIYNKDSITVDGGAAFGSVMSVMGAATFGSTGKFVGQVRAGTADGVSQVSSLICARAAGNAYEFGHPDAGGYVSTFGATYASAFPFIAFNSECDTTGNTFTTRGKLGVVIRSDMLGALAFCRLTNSNASGQSLTESARFDASGHFLPGADNTMNVGSASKRAKEIFAGTGTINTSDAREKEWRGGLSEAELRVAKRISKLIGIYRWLDAITEKGDAARLHVGVTAQDVKAAFEAEGLDGFDYGLLCYDEWDARPAVVDDDGNVEVPAREAGDRYGVRYDELWAFVAAGFEARLSALEAV
ncbi:MAG: tail fiber domain-containing protein [Xanthobacteraceae bacterium]